MHGLACQPSTPLGKEDAMAHLLRRSTLVAGLVGCILCGSLSGASVRIEQVKLSNGLSEGNAALCEKEFPSDARAALFLK
jgi:hypothetical protein